MSLRLITTVAVAALGAAACAKSATGSAPATAPAPASPSAPSSSAMASTASTASAGASGVTAQMVAAGDSLYHTHSCRSCHGADAKGAQNGPNLTSGQFMHIDGSYASIVHIITTGVPQDSVMDPSHRFGMPARGGARGGGPLNDDQVKDVAAYIYSLSHR